MRKTLYALCTLVLFSACNKYLSVSPDSNLDVEITSQENIAEMITAAYPEASYFAFLEARTDNVAERRRGEHSQLNEAMYFWNDYDQEDLDTPLNYWNACYKGIAQVNQALELLSKYPKTPRTRALYGEAFLLRAYLHFMLVNIWAEPYGTERAASSPGIPYVTSPERHVFGQYKRSTVAEVYRLIEADLKRGISLVDDNFYSKPKYHFNKKAAYAFASRFYLMTGQWELVVKYADYVLGFAPKQMLRSWTKLEKYRNQLDVHYLSKEEPANLLLTTTESRIARELPIEKYGTTINHMKRVYDNVKLNKNSSSIDYMQLFPFVSSPTSVADGFYIPKFDELSVSDAATSKPRGLYVTNVLFSGDEVMLNRMEAYAMLGQYDKAIDDLLDFWHSKLDITPSYDRNEYTWTSEDDYKVYTPFYGMTIEQLALVRIITGLRQREFLHEGLRWFDIRRFYLPVKRESKHPLYTPLAKEDPRKVLQLPSEAIKQGLEANPR